MGRRGASLLLLAALIVAAATKQSTSITKSLKPKNPDAWQDAVNGKNSVHGPPSTSIEDNRNGNATTMGAVTQLARLIHPLTEIMLLIIDSWLRNTKNKALPCKISSFVPLKGVCTPIK